MTGCIETPRGTSHCCLGLCRIVAEEFEITEQDCTLYLRQICRGVEYLHKAECHLNGRNFRSRNISIESRCSGRVIHLTSPISHFTVFNSHQIIFPLKAKHFTFGFESKIYLLIPHTHLSSSSRRTWSVSVPTPTPSRSSTSAPPRSSCRARR